jgi:hypothetical protein
MISSLRYEITMQAAKISNVEAINNSSLLCCPNQLLFIGYPNLPASATVTTFRFAFRKAFTSAALMVSSSR